MVKLTLKRVFKTKFEYEGDNYVETKMMAFVDHFLPILSYAPEEMGGLEADEYSLLANGGLTQKWWSLWTTIQKMVSSYYKKSRLGFPWDRMIFGTVSYTRFIPFLHECMELFLSF